MLIKVGGSTYRFWWQHQNWVGTIRTSKINQYRPIRTTYCFAENTRSGPSRKSGQVVFASFAKTSKEDGRRKSLADLLHHLGWNKKLRTRVWKEYFDRKGD